MQQKNIKTIALLATLALFGVTNTAYAATVDLETADRVAVSTAAATVENTEAVENVDTSTVEGTDVTMEDAVEGDLASEDLEKETSSVAEESISVSEVEDEAAVSDPASSSAAEESISASELEDEAIVSDPASSVTLPTPEEMKAALQDAVGENVDGKASLQDPSASDVDGAASVLPEDGIETQGLVKTDSGLEYTDPSGTKYVNRWKTIDGNTYYFGADGKAVSGLLVDSSNGVLYYFDTTTHVQYKDRWKTVNGDTYLFDGNGVARRGWFQNPTSGDRYYFDEYEYFQYKDAVAVTDQFSAYLNKNGVALNSGIQNVVSTGDVYYFDPVTGELYQNRWKTLDGNTYYFGAGGAALQGLQIDATNGATYYFDANSRAQYKNRWKTLDGNTYWFNANGTAVGGLTYVGDVMHYFDPVSRVQYKNRWKTLEGKTFWFNANGVTQKGLFIDAATNVTYFFDNVTGVQAKGQLVEINGATYYFNQHGVMVKNTTVFDAATNYQIVTDRDGRVIESYFCVDGTQAVYDAKGNLLTIQTPNMKNNRVMVKFSNGVPWMYDLVFNQKKTYGRGVVTIGSERFFFNSNGSLASGTQLLKYGDVYQVSEYGLIDEKKTQSIQYGIDVSRWNGYDYGSYSKSNVDFKSLKAQGVDYVIIRAGSGANGIYKDQLFEEQYSLAKEAGLGVGAYFYTYATNTTQAAKEMDRYLSYIQGKTFDYPVYIDMEEDGYSGAQGNLSRTALTDLAIFMMERLESKGYMTGVYANAYWFESKFQDERLAPYEVWLAEWRNGITYEGLDVGMWQYTDSGTFEGHSSEGHSSKFDLNVSLRDYPTIIRGALRNGYLSEM